MVVLPDLKRPFNRTLTRQNYSEALSKRTALKNRDLSEHEDRKTFHIFSKGIIRALANPVQTQCKSAIKILCLGNPTLSHWTFFQFVKQLPCFLTCNQRRLNRVPLDVHKCISDGSRARVLRQANIKNVTINAASKCWENREAARGYQSSSLITVVSNDYSGCDLAIKNKCQD